MGDSYMQILIFNVLTTDFPLQEILKTKNYE